MTRDRQIQGGYQTDGQTDNMTIDGDNKTLGGGGGRKTGGKES